GCRGAGRNSTRGAQWWLGWTALAAEDSSSGRGDSDRAALGRLDWAQLGGNFSVATLGGDQRGGECQSTGRGGRKRAEGGRGGDKAGEHLWRGGRGGEQAR